VAILEETVMSQSEKPNYVPRARRHFWLNLLPEPIVRLFGYRRFKVKRIGDLEIATVAGTLSQAEIAAIKKAWKNGCACVNAGASGHEFHRQRYLDLEAANGLRSLASDLETGQRAILDYHWRRDPKQRPPLPGEHESWLYMEPVDIEVLTLTITRRA
jgi:alkylhydroperoxidase family enzyme